MIGVESPSNGKLFYNFNLEKKVRKNHPLRKLKEILNLDFMYSLLKDKYGTNGNVSVLPPGSGAGRPDLDVLLQPAAAVEGGNRDQLHPVHRPVLVAAIEEEGPAWPVKLPGEILEIAQVTGVRPGGGLDLDSVDGVVDLEDQVDLLPADAFVKIKPLAGDQAELAPFL